MRCSGPAATRSCRNDIQGDPALFGAAAGLVRSQALLRLSFSRSAPVGLMCIGTRNPGHFSSRPRDRAADLPRPRARNHHRPVARPRPVTREKARLSEHRRNRCRWRGSAAADDLRAAIGLWAAWLAGERRASAHTVAAYGRDLAFFLDFLTEHLGELPSLAAIDGLRPADFRAYLARRAADGMPNAARWRGDCRCCAALSAFCSAAGLPRRARSRCCARPSCRRACQSR